jgi:hypothetical protein
MNQERAALLGESLVKESGGLLPYAAVTDPEILVRTPTFLRSVHPVTIADLTGRDRSMAFVEICPSLKYSFLWVYADNNDYRSDYRSFLRNVHQVKEDLPETIHVDHLYNRDRARQFKTPFIRLVLCPAGINISHGAGYEKKRGLSDIGRPGREHKMDEITLMKLCGLRSPRKGQPLTPEMMGHVHSVARLYGLRVEEIIRNINDLMKVADSSHPAERQRR